MWGDLISRLQENYLVTIREQEGPLSPSYCDITSAHTELGMGHTADAPARG